MKFEGEHRAIPLLGIERNATNMATRDGAMNEVVGLIPRNGSLIAYAPTDRGINKANNVVMVRVHHTTTGDNIITVRENNYLINGKDVCEQIVVSRKEIWENNGNCGQQILEKEEEIKIYDQRTVLDIVFIGNRMDILTKENGIEHWLWKNGQYENQNDLQGYYTKPDGEAILPSVDFKVRRGIYDGKTVYSSARYVKVHKNYTDSNTQQEDKEAASNYVRELGSVGSDAVALLDSVRFMGGVTGYVLVAAAYRKKGSDASSPQYMMASPIMLMGAPEIYTKDDLFEKKISSVVDYVKKPTDTFMLDMFSYANRGVDGGYSQEEVFDEIWSMRETDDREPEDIAEGENANIETLTSDDKCIIRQITSSYKKGYTESYKADEALILTTSQTAIQQPSLYCTKYALYNHGSYTGTIDREAEYRGFRISHASANVLSFRVNGEILEKYKDEVDTLCLFISPVISPYKNKDAVGVVMKSNYSGNKKDKYDGFFFCEKTCSGNYKMYKSACGGSFTPDMKSNKEILQEISDIAGLYQVKTIAFKDIKANNWVDLDLSGGILDSDRMVQHSDTMLKISDMQPVELITGGIFGYNERLHVYNFQKRNIYKWPYGNLPYHYDYGQYPVQNTGVNEFEYSIEVLDHNGSLIANRFKSDTPAINPLISCADIDAKSIRVVKRMVKYGKYYVGSQHYTPTKFAGIASGYFSSNLKPLDIQTKEVSLAEYNGAFSNSRIEADSEAYGKNEIKVSEPGTTEFKLEKGYKVGNGEILALARMTMGLSQDNYGKYPLVIFTTDGIYTLDVDTTGEGAYNIQSPLSRLVCTNPNGICEIDGAVLFPTEYGLHMVTVNGVKPIVLQANGKPWNTPDNSVGLGMYRNAINHKKIVKMLDSISYDDFLNYINAYSKEDAKIAARYGTHLRYLHAINSVVVYNREMPYSYMIDLGTWNVTKLEQRIMFDDSDFPKQTFWIEPKYKGSVSIEQEVATVEVVDGKEVTKKRKEWVELSEVRKRIDGKELLQRKLEVQIDQVIDDKFAELDSKISYNQTEIQNLDESLSQYEATDDSIFEDSQTTKSEVLAKLVERKEELQAEIIQLQEEKAKWDAALQVDYASLDLSDEDEAILNEVGLQSVGKMLKSKQKKNDYDALENELVDAEMRKKAGVADITTLAQKLGVVKLTLTYSKGEWVTGKRKYTTEQLSGAGLQVATELKEGLRYQINIANDNHTAVQFDYFNGHNNVQCLLQTRPIKLDTTHLKSAYRVVLRGAFENVNNTTRITTSNGNKISIINDKLLSAFCGNDDVELHYVQRERITYKTDTTGEKIEKKTYSWEWVTKDDKVVSLKDIGLQQEGSISGSDSMVVSRNDYYAGLYVFGSLDGNHWTPIGAEEKLLSNNRFHDIGCRTHRVSVRYLMVVFAGNLSADSHIDGLEITSDVKYNNKLK